MTQRPVAVPNGALKQESRDEHGSRGQAAAQQPAGPSRRPAGLDGRLHGRSVASQDVVRVGEDGALVTYRAVASRAAGAQSDALMTSVYAKRAGSWQLVLHQQTPVTSGG